MNQSIYLMVSVPYCALGILGFFVWRGLRKNAAYLEQVRTMRPSQEPTA